MAQGAQGGGGEQAHVAAELLCNLTCNHFLERLSNDCYSDRQGIKGGPQPGANKM